MSIKIQEDSSGTAVPKEARHYVSALRTGYEALRNSGLIHANDGLDPLLSITVTNMHRKHAA